MARLWATLLGIEAFLVLKTVCYSEMEQQLLADQEDEKMYQERAEDIKKRIAELKLETYQWLTSRISEKLIVDFAEKVSGHQELAEAYAKTGALAEEYDPPTVLDEMVTELRDLFSKRLNATRELATVARNQYINHLEETDSVVCAQRLNDVATAKQCLFSYPSARTNDRSVRFLPQLYGNDLVNVSEPLVLHSQANLNYNGNPVNFDTSAVVVPLPIYTRELSVLQRIKWSDMWFDKIAKQNLQKYGDDMGFQFLCSSDGFFRFYPATLWKTGYEGSGVDLFDCRITPWYVDAVSGPRQVVIMLDASGSMMGQRYEIAKQTIELILDTLTEDDSVNILEFNDKQEWAVNCTPKLMQATTRNKRLLRAAIDIDTQQALQELAVYPKALNLALETLQNFTDASSCNKIIIIVTDGASENYEAIFKMKNPDKKIRVFAFLVGDTSTQFSELRDMACANRGFFVHIPNLGIAQSKIMHYIEVLSRPLAYALREDILAGKLLDAVWSGAKLSYLLHKGEKRAFWYSDSSSGTWNMTEKWTLMKPLHWSMKSTAVTVALPVIHITEQLPDVTVLGVVGTEISLQQLISIAAPFKLGGNGYTFMVDLNGYVFFHPQLRPNTRTWDLKPNYNGVEFAEVEILEDENARIGQMRGERSVSQPTYDAFVAYDYGNLFSPRRVYQQQVNVFYSGVSDEIPYSVGFGLPREKGSFGYYRINISQVDLTVGQRGQNISHCFAGSDWRLHPIWIYCRARLNDTYLEKSFVEYVLRYEETGVLPEPCNKFLVNHVLLDAKATCDIETRWIGKRMEYNTDERGILLMFVSTHAGLTRYVNMNLEDIEYLARPVPTGLPKVPYVAEVEDDNATQTGNESLLLQQFFTSNKTLEKLISAARKVYPSLNSLLPYIHFIDRHINAIDEPFYQRAVRFPGLFIFDVDLQNRLLKMDDDGNYTEFQTIYGEMVSESVVVIAYKAVHLGKAPAAVVGFEMMYHNFADMVNEIIKKRCPDKEKSVECYIIDDTGFIIYTSKNDSISHPEIIGRFLGEFEPCVFRRMAEHVNETGGPANNSNIFQEIRYVDYQGECDEKKDNKVYAAGGRLGNPIIALWNCIQWMLRALLRIIASYVGLDLLLSQISKSQGFTLNFRYPDPGLTCDRVSIHYNANFESKNLGKTLLAQLYTCDEMICEKTFVVNHISGSNLFFLAIRTNDYCPKTLGKCNPANKCDFFYFPRGADFTTKVDGIEKAFATDSNNGNKEATLARLMTKPKGQKKPRVRQDCRTGMLTRARGSRLETCVAYHKDDNSTACDSAIQLQKTHWILPAVAFTISYVWIESIRNAMSIF